MKIREINVITQESALSNCFIFSKMVTTLLNYPKLATF